MPHPSTSESVTGGHPDQIADKTADRIGDTILGAHAWSSLPAAQQPQWPDPDALGGVLAFLRSSPPLVYAAECDRLSDRLAAVARGRRSSSRRATARRPSTAWVSTRSTTS